MSYSVKKGKDGYDVYEKDTDQIIELCSSFQQTKDIVRKLNLGSGFNGFTPCFFAYRFENLVLE